MSASFASASTQYLVNAAPPVITMPITVAGWFRTISSSTSQVSWTLGDTAGANNFFRLRLSSGNQFILDATAAGSTTGLTIDSYAATSWYFVIARLISATNRRAELIRGTGSTAGTFASVQSTTSRSPAGIDTMAIGANVLDTVSAPFNGQVAEFWYTDTDIHPSGAMSASLVNQLAYHGPFSVPHVAAAVVEYHSFRTFPESRGDTPQEVYFCKYGRQTWTNTNGVTISALHPPLAGAFVRPGKPRRGVDAAMIFGTFAVPSTSRRRRSLLILG